MLQRGFPCQPSSPWRDGQDSASRRCRLFAFPGRPQLHAPLATANRMPAGTAAALQSSCLRIFYARRSAYAPRPNERIGSAFRIIRTAVTWVKAGSLDSAIQPWMTLFSVVHKGVEVKPWTMVRSQILRDRSPELKKCFGACFSSTSLSAPRISAGNSDLVPPFSWPPKHCATGSIDGWRATLRKASPTARKSL